MKTVPSIHAEIVQCFGFFPALYAPALENVHVLESLWQQTKSCYIQNPLPQLFKLKLAALLSRSCHIPYCLISHSCGLNLLGMSGPEIFFLISRDASFGEARLLQILKSTEDTGWPEKGSLLEDALLEIALIMFQGEGNAKVYLPELTRLIGKSNLDFLTLYLGYNKTCFIWAETHASEMSYENDRRTGEHLNGLLAEEPKLKDFFINYREHFSQTLKIKSVMSDLKDATLRDKSNEARTNELNARLDAIIHNAPIFLTIFDRRGIYTFADGTMKTAKGLTPGSLVGQSIFERYKDHPHVLEEVSRGLKGEKVKTELNVGPDWFHYSSTPVFDASGEVVSVIAIVFDITDRVNAERLTKENQRRLETVLNHAPIILWGTDVNGRVLFSEGKGLAAIGSRPGKMVGDSVFEIYKNRPESLELFKRALSGESVNGIVKNGEVYFDTHYSGVSDESGKVIGMVGLSVDVTARKKSELEKADALAAEAAAKEASRLKSAFLATMSHEIRTPINGVIGMASLLLDTNLTPEQKSYGEAVRTSADTLLTLINDILDLSKAESGKIDLEVIDFELPHLIGSVEKTLHFPIQQKGLTLVQTFDPKVPLRLTGDPTRLRQVLMNLVNNAVKFSAKGVIRVNTKLLRREGSKFHVRFEVSDSGIGISAQSIALLFQPFTQADSTTTRRFGGSGLGLSISKHLVELMGGTIGVTSDPGVGSTFWFELPFESAVKALQEAAEPENATATHKKLRILIAEDNSINQVIAIKMLEKLGHTAVAVANGLEAIKALTEVPYDMIFMDCQMPELDGYDTTRYLRRETSLTYTRIPIVAMTANAMTGDREKCLDAGMDDYVSKPMKVRDLVEVIDRISEKHLFPKEP